MCTPRITCDASTPFRTLHGLQKKNGAVSGDLTQNNYPHTTRIRYFWEEKKNTSLPNHTWINDTPQFIHQPQSNWSTMIHYDPLINSRDMRKNALQDAADRLSTNICFPFWIQSWEVECLRTWHIREAIKSSIMENIFWWYIYSDLHVCRIRDMYRSCCPKVHDEQGWQNSSHDKRVIDNWDKYWNTTYESTPYDWKCTR